MPAKFTGRSIFQFNADSTRRTRAESDEGQETSVHPVPDPERDSLLQGEHLLLLVLVVVHLRTVGQLVVPRLEHKEGGTRGSVRESLTCTHVQAAACVLCAHGASGWAGSVRCGSPLNLSSEVRPLVVYEWLPASHFCCSKSILAHGQQYTYSQLMRI